ncbi:hypothetical protein TSOC_013914, partial [Tetrabaena socialis]
MLFERLAAQSAACSDRAIDGELFRTGPDGRRRARCLLVDTEPKVVNAVLAADRDGLFTRQQCYLGLYEAQLEAAELRAALEVQRLQHDAEAAGLRGRLRRAAAAAAEAAAEDAVLRAPAPSYAAAPPRGAARAPAGGGAAAGGGQGGGGAE